jgi:hypothetical protein
MFDSRLRLSDQVVERIYKKTFNDMVFDTIIQRNVKLIEAPSFLVKVSSTMVATKELQIIYISGVIRKTINNFLWQGNKKQR